MVLKSVSIMILGTVALAGRVVRVAETCASVHNMGKVEAKSFIVLDVRRVTRHSRSLQCQ